MAAPSEPVPFSVSGKTAIVTGAGSGINFSFASLLLSKNCNVLFADLSLRPEAQKIIEEYSAKTEGKARAVFVETDVVDWKQLSRMFEVAVKEFGKIDIVCPGAGIFEPHWTNFWHPPGTAKSKDSPDGGRYALLDINLNHPIRTTQLALHYFLDPPQGAKASPTNPKRIVHISSIAGQIAGLATPLYIASKHAISGFVRSLARLDGDIGVRVNGVAPGIIKTPLWTEHQEKMHMLDESKDVWATPEEVAEAMLRCVESDELPGGTILEVGHDQTRKVTALNDPGPSGSGHTVSGMPNATAEVLQWLGQPGWGREEKESRA